MKRFFALALSVMMILSLAACGSASSTTAGTNASSAGSSAAGSKSSGDDTDYSAITEDSSTKTVKIFAEINGKYFSEPTHHCVVYREGKNGEKSVMRAFCTEKAFYQAMIDIGAVPGDNLGDPAEDGATVEGDKLNVTVSWDGSDGEIPLSECIMTDDGQPYDTDIRFGGNIKQAYKYGTGCILCLFSCYVGITSNAAYGYGTLDSAGADKFYGNPDVLPQDGTIVTVTFTVV